MQDVFKPRAALIFRLLIGLSFGLGIAVLGKTFNGIAGAPVWVETLTSVLFLGAFILWAGAGVMRWISLTVWGIVALGLIALIAWNRAAHDLDQSYNPLFLNLGFLIYPFLFISHELVASADQARRPLAPYALYFDEAWQRGVQLCLSGLFTGLFWAILMLGAALLSFIGFHWFKDLITNPYVVWPLTGIAIAAAVQLGDTQPKLIHGFRGLVLGVLAWLLPVITLIGLLFAVSLCFSGLQPLWNTKAATAALLAACVALVLLINAAWQDGDGERPIVLRIAARVACGLLVVFAALAAVSLALRIRQYGLTPERCMALVAVIVASLYALGYAVAAVDFRKGGWLALLAPVNTGLAMVTALILLCVLTPIADPYRLSAASQAARVDSGKVTPDKFDWRVLRFQTGTYGRDELTRLGKTGHNDAIRNAALADSFLKYRERYGSDDQPKPPVLTKPDPKQFTLILPAKGVIPADFFAQTYEAADHLPPCATGNGKCQAALIDLDHDGNPEILILDNLLLTTFSKHDGHWLALTSSSLSADNARDFAAGRIYALPNRYDNVRVGGRTVHLDDRASTDGDKDFVD
jgi:hypothetical protein